MTRNRVSGAFLVGIATDFLKKPGLSSRFCIPGVQWQSADLWINLLPLSGFFPTGLVVTQ
jgi:hypothetical protein